MGQTLHLCLIHHLSALWHRASFCSRRLSPASSIRRMSRRCRVAQIAPIYHLTKCKVRQSTFKPTVNLRNTREMTTIVPRSGIQFQTRSGKDPGNSPKVGERWSKRRHMRRASKSRPKMLQTIKPWLKAASLKEYHPPPMSQMQSERKT